ncbi:beta-N-acetylhexosaminidase [Brevibacillus humidisoli]|uniref:beta-N-acetylhexosaminidase n=1 Tax=Brevibacillus humidisoli TaxID=2895522 RepID=UPI001E5D14AB|nr:beta-N-acetylhexosaminidase [Brevibacillus humidisoli]UFJ39529.1 beta-N-acetylhexosaminidase [Brevibacillus humidisoli]
MKGRSKRILIGLLLCLLLAAQAVAAGSQGNGGERAATDHVGAASTEGSAADLIIYQNVPEVEAAASGQTLRLSALHVYEDGHFAKVTEGLTWESSNITVASVENGVVTAAGKPGRTFVTVTDGHYTDRIALDVRMDPQPKQKGKPESVITIVKEEGERYQIIDRAVQNMTLEEKIGQMLMPDFRKYNGQDVIKMLPEIEQQIKKYHIGGVILFRENVVTTEQTLRLVDAYRQAAEKYGLLISIDQEGGIVTRLQSGTDLPGNMALGAARSTELAEKTGDVIGRELASLGFNMDLAPVLDVNNNPDNPVIGVRSFAEDPQLVADLGIAYTRGLQQNGIAATAKHFPGHGDTSVDSHLGLPEVPHDKERLVDVELYPFQQAIDAGIDAIMTAHVTFPKIDNTKVVSRKDGTEIALPATLSEKVLTGLIRDELQFDGVVITDAMNMQAITDHFGPVDAAVRAVKAGVDIVLMPVGLQEVSEGLQEAVASGEIPQQRIDTAVKRILTLKVKRGIMKEETPVDVEQRLQEALQIVGAPEHKAVEAEAAAASITLVKNEQVLPLGLDDNQEIAVVGTSYLDSLVGAVKSHHANTVPVQLEKGGLTAAQWELLDRADVIIIGSYTYNVSGRSADNETMKAFNQIISKYDKPVVAVGIRNPYDVMAYPDVDAYLAQYGFRAASFAATANVLFGEQSPAGKLPVTIPDSHGGVLYRYGHGLGY